MVSNSTVQKIKVILKKLIPRPILRGITGIFYGWHGNFNSWEEASSGCTGYNSQIILDKVSSAALIVKEGKASFERDSVIYDEPQFNHPVLSALLMASAENHSSLNVLDFGGSLGSTYYQNKAFLDSVPELNWCIVEQENYVREGIKKFADKKLHFFYTAEECMSSFRIDVVLLSSVLQYLENPYSLLSKFTNMGIRYIIIDRSPFVKTKSRITVQKVHPAIYRASYPCWFFNEAEFISYFRNKYILIDQFRSLDEANIKSVFKGFVFRINDNQGKI